MASQTVLVPEKDHGRIIGRGGATIKEVEQSFRVRVQLVRGSEEVRVEGQSLEDVHNALAKIAQLVGYVPRVHGAAAVVPALQLKDLSAPTIREALFFPDATGASYDTFVAYLRSAKKSVDVCVYTISDEKIENILVAHRKAGIRVRVITDNDTVSNTGSDIKAIADSGIEVRLDGAPGSSSLRASAADGRSTSSLMHHKFCILDGRVLINGSYNWTSTAKSLNSENLIITNDSWFVEKFAARFEQMWGYFAGFRFQ